LFKDINKKLLEKYKESDFLNGGCYIYAKLVTNQYGGEIYINRLLEHCAVYYDGNLYDITGRIKNTDGFRPLKSGEEVICEVGYRLKGLSYDDFIHEYNNEIKSIFNEEEQYDYKM